MTWSTYAGGVVIPRGVLTNFQLARVRGESLKRVSNDWIAVATSLESEEAARRLGDLSHPPDRRRAMRSTGLALAAAPEPVSTVAGVALLIGSLAMNDEPATLGSVGDALHTDVKELSSALDGLDLPL